MKKLLVLTALLLLSTVAYADGHGSAFGTLTTAEGSGAGTGSFTLMAGFADATSFGGSFNYGLSEHTDGRLRLIIVDNDPYDSRLAFGADFKYNFLSADSIQDAPFNMALGGLFEYYDYEGFSVMLLGAQFIGSLPIKLDNNSYLTPYGRFNARLERFSHDNDAVDSDSKLEFGLNAGVKWQMTNSIDLYGEFQLDGNDGLFVGLDFNIM